MNETAESSSSNRQIARAAGTVMLAIMFGQLLGLLRGILVARSFPAADLDAFFAANRVSETIFMLIAAGALGSAFIPTFTGMLARGEKPAAWKLASSLANLLLLILSSLALIAALLAPAIVKYLLAPGFSRDAALFSLTVDLLRIQLASVVLFGLGGLLVGILNAHQVFFVPALTPSMYQLGLIFGVIALAPRFGVRGLAWGVVVGALLYLALQLPYLGRLRRRHGQPSAEMRYTPTLGLRDKAVLEVLRLMLPRILGIGVVQVNFWVNTWLASQMQRGSVTGLQYGFSLMLMAQAAIAQSAAIAAMPTLSAQHALGKTSEFRNLLAGAIRSVSLLAFPAAAGLMLLRQPIVAVLYQRGEFDARMTALVSWALFWFAAGLVGHSILEVLTRAFYAQHDTRTPVIVGASAMLLNLILSFVLSSAFDRVGWMPHGGLALANSLATALEATGLYILMRRRLAGMRGRSVGIGLLQAGLGTAAMCAAILPVSLSSGPSWLKAAGGVILGAVVYLGVMRLQRVPELDALMAGLRRRLVRRA